MSHTPTSEREAPPRGRQWLLELFIAGNLGFLAIDVYTAHAVNSFGHKAEWIPFVFSLAAPLLLIPAWISPAGVASAAGRLMGFVVGGGAILVGVAGLIYHLEGTFFVERTLKSLVYTAPFAAPLAYTGLGMLLLVNRLEPTSRDDWGSWVVFLAMGGFVGNFALSLADHAQNGFFVPTEWIAVFAAALAVGFLLVASGVKTLRRPLFLICVGAMVLQIAIGLLGFGFHFVANVQGPEQTLWRKFVFGTPVFAPLLYVDLALLAWLGLWHRWRHNSLHT